MVAATRRIDLAAAFARSLLSWYVDGVPIPLSTSFAVTHRCNLRCSYCNTPFLDPSELPLDAIERLFDRLRALGVKRVGLTGGEPLLRKDIGEIVRLARDRGFFVTLNSNLQLFESRRASLGGVDLFFTSLDGDRATHESARGRGSHDGVLRAIRQLVAEGRPVIAICVVDTHNLEASGSLLSLAENEGFRIHFQPRSGGAAIVRGDLSGDLPDERLRGFWRGLLSDKAKGRPVASSRPYLRALATWRDFRRPTVQDPTTRCGASRAFLHVDPQGKAFPCAYTKGVSEPVDMLGPDWRSAIGRETPCSRCAVGPYLEFNLLYRNPFEMGFGVARSYLSVPMRRVRPDRPRKRRLSDVPLASPRNLHS